MNYFMKRCRLCTTDQNVSFTIFNLDFDDKYFLDKLEVIVPEIINCNISLPNGLCTICAVQLNEADKFIKQCFDSQIILKTQHVDKQLCRLCANNDNLSLTLNSMDSDNILVSYKLETIAPEILECNEKLSDKICSICSVRLNETYKFREKCFKSLEIFKRKFQNSDVIKNEIVQDSTISLNKNENNTNFETVYIKKEIINEEATVLGLENDINIKVEQTLQSENNTTFAAVFIKEENINEDYESDKNTNFGTVCIKEETNNVNLNKVDLKNNTNIKMEEKLHSELIIKDESIFDSKTYQVDKNMNGNDNLNLEKDDNNIFVNKEVHIEEKIYKCKTCEEVFIQRASLTIHIRSHINEKPFKCKICGKDFQQKADLRTHLRKHKNEKSYKCEICKKVFTTGGSLKEHIRIHTNERPYKCEICEKTFTQSGHLQTHIRRHGNVKPYKCETCEKTFTKNGDLKVHIRSHTQEKPFKCKMCQNAYTTSGSLSRHILSHTNEKPYKCKLCDKAFTQGGSLKVHIRSHTKEGSSN